MHYIQVKGILSAKNGMNLYRGCSHGCIYCDSRSRCYQMDHDFEDIAVKENALALLEDALRRRRAPCMIGTGSMSDPYLPLEARLGLTRRAVELLARYGFGCAVLTKSAGVLRDLDLFQRIHRQAKCVVQMTLTTHDEALCRQVEPNVSTTAQRVAALRELRAAGIPTVVWLSPILPFLNDTAENLTGILEACIDAGVRGIVCFGMGMTLRAGNREYFYDQLDRLFPGLKARYQRRYGGRYQIASPRQPELMRQLYRTCARAGILHRNEAIFQYLTTLDQRAEQLSLW